MGFGLGKMTVIMEKHPAKNVPWVSSKQIGPYLQQPVALFKGNATKGSDADLFQYAGILSGQDPPRLTQTPYTILVYGRLRPARNLNTDCHTWVQH